MTQYADQRAHDVNEQTAAERERAQQRVNLLALTGLVRLPAGEAYGLVSE